VETTKELKKLGKLAIPYIQKEYNNGNIKTKKALEQLSKSKVKDIEKNDYTYLTDYFNSRK